MEKLYGKPYADMLAILGYQDLQLTLAEFGPNSPATCLKLKLENQNPDDGMNDVAYEKGYLLLLQIEKAVGREAWDAFLKKYFDQNAFSTMTTEGFLAYLDGELIKGNEALAAELNLKGWIYSPGLPTEHQQPQSARFDSVDAQLARWAAGTAAHDLAGTDQWSTHEWLHFIRHLPEDLDIAKMGVLDKEFHFTASGNAEILAAWFEHVIRMEYEPGYKALENFLVNVGRRKFVRPLFKLLSETEPGIKLGKMIYAKARPNYHSVTRGTVDEILGYE
jgi:leukotriene-A4 hydrolase